LAADPANVPRQFAQDDHCFMRDAAYMTRLLPTSK
jgi:hypothetical protein